jgi:hypothetical protein
MRNLLFVALIGAVAACSPVQPIASARYDGHYSGTRRSNSNDACGISDLRGRTHADIVGGEITLPLFGPRSMLEGTVGASGEIRASGMWQSQPTSHFPGITTFTGQITGGELDGEASNFKCQTIVRLRRTQPALPVPPLPPRHKSARQCCNKPASRTP